MGVTITIIIICIYFLFCFMEGLWCQHYPERDHELTGTKKYRCAKCGWKVKRDY